MKERTMPHSIEAEQTVLGSCFLSKYALDLVCESLNSESFYLNSHAKIYSVLSELQNEKKPVDIVAVSEKLRNKKELAEVGGVEYLLEIVNSVPSASNVEYYIDIVNEKAIRRKLIEASSLIASSSYEDDGNTLELLDDAERQILTVIKNRKTTEFKSIQNVLAKAQDDLEKLAEAGSDITGIASGFSDIDKLTSGFHGSELIIIAARPAMGKTAFALNIATNVAINSKKSVAIFNLEMSAEQLAFRMISSLGQIQLGKIRTGHLEHNDWKRVNEAVSQLADTNIFIDDTPGIKISEIRAKCRRLASSPEGLGIVIIDYLQLISGSSHYAGNRQQEVSEISRLLKTMALELNVPVIALAQLSRAVEGREDKRPLMSDLRESGSIEQDADMVSFLYRDDYYNKESKKEGTTSESEFIVGKNRSGPTATINLLFKRDTGCFINYKKEEE